jgi:hypothetical protein
MLKKVRKPRTFRVFVLGAYMVHHRNGNDRCRVVFVQQYFEAIGHIVLGKLDILGSNRRHTYKKADYGGYEYVVELKHRW